MTGIEQQVLQAIDRGELQERLTTLVRIPSVTGQEEKIQHVVAGWLRELGARIDLWTPDVAALQADPRFPGARVLLPRPNLVGIVQGRGDGPTLVLNGHVDTVGAGDEAKWQHPPWSAEVVDGRLYGRGASDMKGGLVAMLGAVQAIIQAGITLNGDIVVHSVIGEEDGGLGTFAALVKGYLGDAAIVGEPTALAIAPAQAGVTLFRLTVEGRAAHACCREEGVSAFEASLGLVQAIRRFEADRVATIRHPLYEGIPLPWAVNLGIISSGEWPSIVPEKAVFEGRIGAAVGESVQAIRHAFAAALAAEAEHDPWLRDHPPKLEWIGGMWESAETPADHKLPTLLGESLRKATGRTPKLQGMTYGSDMRLFTNLFGIPAVLFGPGDIRRAHFTDEYVELDEVEAASRVLALTILHFSGVA